MHTWQSFNVMFCFIHIIVSKITLQAAKLLKCTQVVQRVQSPFLKKKKYNNKKKFRYGLAETYHSDMMHTAPAPNSLPEASSVRYRSHWSPMKPWLFAIRQSALLTKLTWVLVLKKKKEGYGKAVIAKACHIYAILCRLEHVPVPPSLSEEYSFKSEGRGYVWRRRREHGNKHRICT